MEVSASHPAVRFNGVTYYFYGRYYSCSPESLGLGDKRNRYLHRAVWRHHFGDIPPGMAVHHVDHDRTNNDVSNLELLPRSEHCSYHTRKRLRDGDPSFTKSIELAREAAKAWHGSPEGLAWHREHGKSTWEGRVREAATCAHCGKGYAVFLSASKRGFCSPACQSAARRASGVDDEARVCLVCGGAFTVNRYAKTKTCSKACSTEAMRRAKARTRLNRSGGA